jgi:hypothetical protein
MPASTSSTQPPPPLLFALELEGDSAESIILQADLHSALITRSALAQGWEEVGDIIPRMTIETGAQSLLIQIMGNQTDAATENEEAVENAHAEVVLRLFGREGAAVAEQVDKADGHATVDVEDQVVFLGGGDCLHCDGVVEQFVGGEVLGDEFLNELHAKIGVGSRFDAVTDTRD